MVCYSHHGAHLPLVVAPGAEDAAGRFFLCAMGTFLSIGGLRGVSTSLPGLLFWEERGREKGKAPHPVEGVRGFGEGVRVMGGVYDKDSYSEEPDDGKLSRPVRE